MKKNENHEPFTGHKSSIGLFVVACLCVLGVCLAWTAFVLLSERPLEKSGQFGDSFGVLNSLFSGLAFSGVIITILLQRKELALQRTELELTRGVLEDTAAAQQRQVDAMEKSAKLTAISTLAQARTDISLAASGSRLPTTTEHTKVSKERDASLAELEEFIKD